MALLVTGASTATGTACATVSPCGLTSIKRVPSARTMRTSEFSCPLMVSRKYWGRSRMMSRVPALPSNCWICRNFPSNKISSRRSISATNERYKCMPSPADTSATISTKTSVTRKVSERRSSASFMRPRRCLERMARAIRRHSPCPARCGSAWVRTDRRACCAGGGWPRR